MKKTLLKFSRKLLLTTMLAFACYVANATQLSGTYTIDSAGTPSTTVFKDFNSAVIYLTSASARPDGGPSNSAPFGISGPVEFQVMQGTYIEQVNIPAIPGTSTTNTVTFDGGTGNASSRILEHTAATSTNAHTLRFNGCNNVIVKNLTILGKGSFSIGVHFYSSISTFNITLKKCSVMVTIPTSGGAASSPLKAIAATNSNLSTTGGATSGSAGSVYNIFIDSNYISGGHIGVFLSSNNSSSIPHNFSVRWNNLENVFATGLGASSSQGYLYEGNYIKMVPGNTASIGMQHSNGSTSGVQSYKVIGNTVENAGQYGISFGANNANTAVAYPTLIINNYFKPTFSHASPSAIYLTQARNHRVYNNTVLMNMPAGHGINLGTTAQAGCIVKNNIVELLAPNATGMCVQTTVASIDSCDYNVFIKNSPDQNLLTLRGTTYTKSNFKGNGGWNVNSTMVDPLRASLTNPSPGNICQKGEVVGWVVNDIFGNPRTTPPQIGCAEGAGGVALDAAITKFILPTSSVTAGGQDVEVEIRNSGLNNLTSLNVTVQLGATTYTIPWIGNLSSCQTDTVRFNGANQFFIQNGSNSFKAWVDNPNYSVDSNATNDTIFQTFCTPLSGTYTIGGLTPDFADFTEAADRLNCGGISGPVVFNVSSGVYTGRLALSAIAGSSAASTITFTSAANHRDSVTLTNAGSNTIELSNTSYITIKSISVNQTATTAAMGVKITGNADNVTIEDCNIICAPSSSSSTYIVEARSSDIDSLRLLNNYMSGAYYGIYVYGTSTTVTQNNCTVEGNHLQGVYYNPLYFYYTNNLKYSKNTVLMNGTFATNYNYFYYCNNTTFTNNTFNSAPNITTIYIYMFLGSSNVKVFNNSFNLSHTTGVGPCIYNSVANGIEVKNNVFMNNSSGFAATYYYNPIATYNVNGDYNNYYTNGASLINQVSPALTYAKLINWKTAFPTVDINSLSYPAGFMSATSAIPNPADSSSWSLNGRGIHIASNLTDMNGNTRPATVADGLPDLGAYEFTPTAIAPMATAVPATAAFGTSQSFLFGGDTIAKIDWGYSQFPPTSIALRQYVGERPPLVSAGQKYMNWYVDIAMPYGFYDYTAHGIFKDAWIGTMNTKTEIAVTGQDPYDVWSLLANSTVDTINNMLSAQYLYFNEMVITGTDALNPLPVKLTYLTATKNTDGVVVKWKTASEINASHFVIERSYNNKNFEAIGRTKANNVASSYQYIDRTVDANATPVVYYRLVSVDYNGTTETSKAVSVAFDKLTNVELTVYPNPATSQLNVMFNAPLNEVFNVSIYGLDGKKVAEQVFTNTDDINLNVSNLTNGLYFVKVQSTTVNKVIRFTKD